MAMMQSALMVCLGASAGALARWGFSCALNNIMPALPLGTLAVNLVGALVMGVASGLFACAALSPEWRLLLVTGFLGAFTTFSAFSAEMGRLLLEGRHALLAAGIVLHVGGSIAMFILGLWLFGLFRRMLL